MNKIKIVYLAPQPGPYYMPLFQKLSRKKKINFIAYYKKSLGTFKPTYDSQFNRKIKWDIPLLMGHNYKFLKGILNLVNQLKEDKPDTIIIHGWNSIIDWVAILYSKFLGIKIFLRSESPLNQELKKSNWKLFIKKIILGRVLFSQISAFLYIGEQNKKFYKYNGVPNDKLFFTPYAVDNDRFQKSYRKLKAKKQKLRNNLNIKKNEKVILFVGKLINKKRPLDLLKAYKILNRDDVHLIYVGSGKLDKKLKKYTKDNEVKNVHFVGFKNQTELPEYYTIADVFILPSGAGETWGLVTNEAMNFKLPIIISDTPGSGYDLVEEGKNGFKFEEGNIKSLLSKLKIIIEDEEKCKEFGEKSFKIIQNYNYEKDIKEILNALDYVKKT